MSTIAATWAVVISPLFHAASVTGQDRNRRATRTVREASAESSWTRFRNQARGVECPVDEMAVLRVEPSDRSGQSRVQAIADLVAGGDHIGIGGRRERVEPDSKAVWELLVERGTVPNISSYYNSNHQRYKEICDISSFFRRRVSRVRFRPVARQEIAGQVSGSTFHIWTRVRSRRTKRVPSGVI